MLLRYVIHSLPFSCKVAEMTNSELAAFAPGAVAPDPVDGKPQTVGTHLHRAVNALFLVRQFAMRFVERTDECSLLAHFNHQPTTEFAGVSSHSANTTTRRRWTLRVELLVLAILLVDPSVFDEQIACRFRWMKLLKKGPTMDSRPKIPQMI